MAKGLDNYENVKSRKRRFYSAYPDGRITVELLNNDLEEKAVFKATLYLSGEDQARGLARSTGHALEMRDKDRPKNQYGKEYDSVNYTSWTENCEESAVGRALDNGNFFSDPKCSQEEMVKAQTQGALFSGQTPTSKPASTNGYTVTSDKYKGIFSRQTPTSKPASTNGYTVPFGKYKGKTFDEIAKPEMDNYVDYLMEGVDADRAAGKKPNSSVIDLLSKYNAWYDEKFPPGN